MNTINTINTIDTIDTIDTSAFNQPSHYVGIGASAGGLEALEEFFRTMPNDSGMVFIVVQHLSPDYKSMMVELLSRKTTMQVLQITDGMLPEANRIYLIPPKKNLEIYHAQLFLTEQVRDMGLYLPIDIFFRSLAIDQQKRAIGVILSGTGSDGTLGVRAIKEQGGMIMVQDYTNAKFDGMPKSAIATGLADYVLDADRMSDSLIKYVKHPLVLNANDNDQQTKEETDFVKILSLIRTNVGEDFSYYKPKTIIRRIERRISVNQFQTMQEYTQYLLHSKEECEILAKEFLIGVTQFFRDREAFKSLEELVIPKLFDNYNSENPIRLWSVGCSTGEEAYSIAILCTEYMEKLNIKANLKIFATDLDKEAIKFASSAYYPESIISDVSKDRLQRFFIKQHETYQVKQEIRQMVIFSNHNIIADPPFSKINLITCRNLLIYLKPEIQQKILSLFQYALIDDGFLFLGSSESLSGVSDTFEVLNSKWKIFRNTEKYNRPNLANLLSVRNQVPRMNKIIPSIKMPEEHNANLYQSLYEQVANYFATAGVIIDHNNMIIHFFKDVHKYLRLPEGKASYNLIELADTQLALVISNMLYKLRKERKDVVFTKIRFKQNNQLVFLNLAAHLIQIKRNSRDFIVISFQENNVVELRHSEPSPENYNYDEQVSERIQELERELQYREENLQTTVEELETSNEELQATNEELVAANEELQSTNEELQSVNEELYTVNSQYQEKIIELTTLNNDINNLLANTQIGTLFLDSNLTVRKFTPEITKIINIMEVDVGRPLSHLTFKFKTKINLYQEVEQVLDSLAMREIEINTEDGEWYLLKIQPYRHSDRSIHGILLIQVQITALKQVAASRLKHQELYNLLFETMTQGVIYQDVTGKIFSVNPAAAQILGLDKEQLLGLNFNHPSWRMIRENGTPLPANEHPSLIALNTAQIIKNTVIGIFNPQQEQIRWIKITAIPHFKPNSDTPYQVYSILDDITEQKIAEYRLQQKIQEVQQQQNAKFNAVKLQLNQYMSLINSMPNGLAHYELIKNTNGDVVDFTFITLNQIYSEITGLQANIIGSTAEQISSKIQCNWLEIFTPILLNKQLNEFEYYSILKQQKFTVKIYTPSAGYVATVFIPIS